MSQIIIEDSAWKAIMADERLAAARRKLSFHEIRLIIGHAAMHSSRPVEDGLDTVMLGRFVAQYEEGASGLFIDADEAQEVALQVKAALNIGQAIMAAVDADQSIPTDVATKVFRAIKDGFRNAKPIITTQASELSALKGEIEALRQREVQMIGAAISVRSWHQVETAYNQLRDKIDARLTAFARQALTPEKGK